MRYTKPPVSLVNQVARLKGRGLIFVDESSALIYLSNISYYRLPKSLNLYSNKQKINKLNFYICF